MILSEDPNAWALEEKMVDNIFPYHQMAVDRLVAVYHADPPSIALILIGSVARGEEDRQSDLDFPLVCTDAEYTQRRTERTLG